MTPGVIIIDVEISLWAELFTARQTQLAQGANWFVVAVRKFGPDWVDRRQHNTAVRALWAQLQCPLPPYPPSQPELACVLSAST